MILGIVGCEDPKFTTLGRRRAKEAIAGLIVKNKPDAISSGHCHLGGVDIWAERLASK